MWKEYVLSVVTICLVCSIVIQLLPDSGRKELLRILCGVILATVILGPVSGIRPEDLLDHFTLETASPESCLAVGESAATDMKEEYITEAYEAYILNKAKKLGAQILPVITLDENYLPVSVLLHGSAEPNTQEELARILAEDLGITKEHQQWTGNPENSG